MTTKTTLATFTVFFGPTTIQRTTWLDWSRDSYEIDWETTYEREETFATFEQAALAAFNFCGKASVCCRVSENGPVEFFADADAREDALRQRTQVDGAQNNHLACIVEHKPTVEAELTGEIPF